MNEELEHATVYLIKKYRFYAEILNRLIINMTTDIDSMGVKITTKGVEVSINPWFLKSMTVPEQANVLMHECEHPLRDLVWGSERERAMCPEIYKDPKTMTIAESCSLVTLNYLVNIAEDCAINETIHDLPVMIKHFNKDGTPKLDKDGKHIQGAPITVKSLREMFPNEKIENHQATEYYFSFLKKKRDNGEFKGKNKDGTMLIPIDDHNHNAENAKEIDSKFAEAIVHKLMQEAKEATPGNIPGHMEILLDKLGRSTHDWRKDVRMFRAHCATPQRRSTRKRRNRRYGLLYPGKKRTIRMHLVVAIDSSGSVNDRALAQLMAEIGALKELGIDITVIECDSRVNQVYRYNPNHVPKVKGRGGTDFNPVFDLIETAAFIDEYGEVDGLIFQTDGGDYGPLVNKPDYPVLWALLPGCHSRYEWGRKTYIEVND